MNNVDFDEAMGMTDDQIRVDLRKHFQMAKPVGEMVFFPGLGH